jgi:hypothetical protein
VVGVTYFFQLMQDYGTDQTTVQRMMAIPTLRGVTKAIFFNAAVDFVIVATLLFIGLGLFAYHTAFPDLLPDGLKNDQILPYYIIHALPNGVSGLLITALFAAAMSSMDSGISCVATVIINDFVKPLRGGNDDDAQDLKLARGLTFGLGVFATGLAFYVSTFKQLIEAYSSLISLFNAPSWRCSCSASSRAASRSDTGCWAARLAWRPICGCRNQPKCTGSTISRSPSPSPSASPCWPAASANAPRTRDLTLWRKRT